METKHPVQNKLYWQ